MDEQKAKILVVDDEANNRKLIQHILKDKYRLFFAVNGKEALNVCTHVMPDMILLDIMMPEMDGFEACRHFKNDPKTSDIPLIFITAMNDVKDEAEGFKLGGVDYITKPIVKATLLARINTHLTISRQKQKLETQKQKLELLNTDLEKQTSIAEDMALKANKSYKQMKKALSSLIESQDKQKMLEEKNREYEKKIEQYLLLSTSPENLEGATVASLSIPSGHLDGDFYDFIVYDNKKFDVIIADVMGKGVQSALVGAGFKSIFLKSLSMYDCSMNPRPCCKNNLSDLSRIDVIMDLAHSMSINEMMELDIFLTLCFARFDLDRYLMSYIDCGHTKTIHYHADSSACSFLEGDSLPIGMLEEAQYHPNVIKFDKGDIFLFYSDGITEAARADGEMFQENRLADTLLKYRDLSPDNIIDHIKLTIQNFTGKTSFSDDFSCIVITIDR